MESWLWATCPVKNRNASFPALDASMLVAVALWTAVHIFEYHYRQFYLKFHTAYWTIWCLYVSVHPSLPISQCWRVSPSLPAQRSGALAFSVSRLTTRSPTVSSTHPPSKVPPWNVSCNLFCMQLLLCHRPWEFLLACLPIFSQWVQGFSTLSPWSAPAPQNLPLCRKGHHCLKIPKAADALGSCSAFDVRGWTKERGA